jgi:hypothetical protein
LQQILSDTGAKVREVTRDRDFKRQTNENYSNEKEQTSENPTGVKTQPIKKDFNSN